MFFASAKTGYGIDKLRDFCFSLTNPGDWDYHPAQKLEISDVKVV